MFTRSGPFGRLFWLTLAAVALVPTTRSSALHVHPQVSAIAAAEKLPPALLGRLEREGPLAKAWVFFKDKGLPTATARDATLEQVAAGYNPRAVQRRLLRGDRVRAGGRLFDEHDLPVAPSYIEAVAGTGARVHVASRWLNAVSVRATRVEFEQIARLPFVGRVQPVARARASRPVEMQAMGSGTPPTDRGVGTLDHGYSTAQLNQINVIDLHDAGYTGAGVAIGILDTGFRRTHAAFIYPGHPVNVLAEYDFVNNDGNTGIEPGDPSDQHEHGTLILGCIGAYLPGGIVGGAYDAAFILCKTEDISAEYPAEEDNYVAGLEFIEAHGGDVATSSLGYIDWYTQDDLDGQTTVTTIAVNIATANGLFCCNAAGNSGHDNNPNTSHLVAPGDAFQVITCGAATVDGYIAHMR